MEILFISFNKLAFDKLVTLSIYWCSPLHHFLYIATTKIHKSLCQALTIQRLTAVRLS